MATINLLPWRQERREEQKKEFFTLLSFGCLISVFFIGYIHFMYANWIDIQTQRNEFLKKETKVLDNKIIEIATIKEEKEKVLARMEVIQNLQQNRPDTVRLFNSLVEVVPGGLYFLVVERKGKEIKIEGRGESNTRVSKLMRKMTKSEILSSPRLSVIKAQTNKNSSKQAENFFNLTVNQSQSQRDKGF